MIFKQDLISFKIVNPRENVLSDVEDLFNELHYICKDKYNKEKNGLKSKDTNKFDYKKLRLTDDYQYESEEEKEQQTSRKLDQKGPPKKPTKTDLSLMNGLIKKKQAETVNYLRNILNFKDLLICFKLYILQIIE